METISLSTWMTEKGFTNRTLGERMNLSYDLIYKLTTKAAHGRQMSAAFEMRFIRCFGLEEASRIFGEIPQTEVG